MTDERAADDFAGIAARMREIAGDAEAPRARRAVLDESLWWCEDCGVEITGREVTYQERHDERTGGCGCIVYPACAECENGGWVQVYSPRPPAFKECESCCNPTGRPSP